MASPTEGHFISQWHASKKMVDWKTEVWIPVPKVFTTHRGSPGKSSPFPGAPFPHSMEVKVDSHFVTSDL